MDKKKYQREYIKAYRLRNGDRIRKMESERWHNQTDEQKAIKVAKNKERRQKLRLAAIEYYGGICICCGESEMNFLCIDHIGGGGNAHRKQMTTKSIGEWLYVNNYPDNFRVLCHNCNMAEGIYGSCPHNN